MSEKPIKAPPQKRVRRRLSTNVTEPYTLKQRVELIDEKMARIAARLTSVEESVKRLLAFDEATKYVRSAAPDPAPRTDSDHPGVQVLQ